MKYNIITACIGHKYKPIESHYINRITEKCPNAIIKIINEIPHGMNLDFIRSIFACKFNCHGWCDVFRLHEIIKIIETENIPIIQCDLDIIVEKDLEKLLDIPYDIIFSKEVGGINAYPSNCSKIVGFGICCGFYIIKPTEKSIKFLKKLYYNMINKVYDNTYTDQINIMNMIINSNYTISDKFFIDNNIIYTNKIISLNDEDDIKICVLDFDLITRDPEYTKNQFGNHINIDNVGGADNFIKYYYDKLENLPLVCRCGKMGNTEICSHRKKL